MFGKKPPILLSPKLKTLEDTERVKDYLGKKVYCNSGDFVGRVKDVLLKDQALAGIIVQGRKRLFIDKDYCVPGVIDSVILKIDPVTHLKRKLVFDDDGKRVGRVVSIERTNVKNYCEAIIVKKHLFAKPKRITADMIDVSKKNIILNQSVD